MTKGDAVDMSTYDAAQAELMSNDMCILVDNDDNAIGSASKKDCHLMTNIDKGMLHRAFSVFLFNTNGELLLQQRATEKITFPDHFTNTCCSHPLHFEQELETQDNIGVRRAAQRKLKQELGIEASEVPLDAFHVLSRIHYKAPSNGQWGEHEIDYILIIQRNVTIAPNANEVRSVRWVNEAQLEQLLTDSKSDPEKLPITPWFRLICEHNHLQLWWKNLDNLEQFKNMTIKRL